MKLQLRKSIFRLVLLLPILFHSIGVNAQSDPTGKSAATRTYAITNATIVQAPGKVMEAGTIVIKNGLISTVGKSVTIPDDAEVIDGTDMFVYPGFIDGMSYTAAKRPEPMARPDNLFTPNPPNDYAGITPEHTVISQVDIGEKSISAMRKLGFTISHTVPYGRMLPGSGALLLLSDKDHADKLILAEDASMYTQFTGAPGAYPGNTLGIMAKWRTLYRNATYTKQHAEMYAKDPAGLERPTQDRVLGAFYPVIAKEKSVFYRTPSALHARRAMRMQNDLGFSLVLGNLEESWDLADAIKQHDAKVFMSINLPKEPKDSDDEEKTEEVAQLEARRMDFYNMYLTQYAELNNAGIKFGISSMETSASKFKGNMKLIIDSGLSEEDALAALTIDAAELLGIDDIAGTLDAGKLGNAVVTTGPYFEKKSQVKYVFVDGDKYEYETKEPKKDGEAEEEISEEGMAQIIGSWSFVFTTPQGEQTGKMIFENEGDEVTGIIQNDDGTPDQDMNNISFVNGSLSFDFSFDGGGQSIEVVVVGDVTGTDFEGEASIAVFNVSFPLTASKDSPEE